MPIEWAGLSPELLLSMDRTAAAPLRAQLEEGLREAIRSGRLQVGERLPSSRELARELGVSRGLVQECFGQLQAEGYLSTRVGSATRVAAGACDVPEPVKPLPPPARLRVDFAHGVPDLASFPRGDWLWAQKEICRDAPSAAFDYGEQQGNAAFREILAAYLRRVRQIVASPERIVVCTGFAQGLSIALSALTRTGVRKVAFEDPGYEEDGLAHRERTFGFTAVRVPVDSEGIDVHALENSGAKAVVITPAHQWPTGVVLAPERRHALLEWARRTDGIIIEDDYDAEFRYDRDPVGALQGLAPDRVIALGTVSKSLAPAIRVGWAVAPPALVSLVATAKNESDRGTPIFEQLAVAKLIESGRFQRHLRHMRGIYAARRTALVEALAEHAPSIELTGLAAGFHAVAQLPAGVDETSVIEAARERSVGVYGMADCRSDGAVLPGQLVLGFGNTGERAIREGIALIADLLNVGSRP
jgi:GntR family transcriptional regulator/MocR family aminotransferase